MFRRSICMLISVTLALLTPCPMTSASDLSALPLPAESPPDFNLRSLQEYDPALKEFADADWAPPRDPPYSADDKILDQDPYFMRSQAYEVPFSHGAGNGTAYLQNQRSLEIHVRETRFALKIEQPLAPLFELENFLFLQSTDKNMFLSRFPGGDDYSEGLFFIDKRYLEVEESKATGLRPVPIFFLPLAGGGWTGRIQAVSVEPITAIALRNDEGGSANFDLQMIMVLAQLLHNNVVMATILALKHDSNSIANLAAEWGRHQGEPIELPFVLPPRGSTAAFGTFFTGVNLDNPDAGLTKAVASFHIDLSVFPRAYGSDLLSPDVLDRLLTIGKIAGTVYILSVLAQFTVLRQSMLERRAYTESTGDEIARLENRPSPKRSGIFFRAGRTARESIDVFSHGLATFAAGVGVTSGYILEYGADRFGGRAGRVGWIRWALGKTFLYHRNQNEFIGANWNSFYLGVLILGGIDTMGVVLQLLFVSPIFFPWLARPLGPQMHKKIEAQFSGENPTSNNVLTSEVMRNFSGYFVRGSYQYSLVQRQALMEIVRPNVEKQMLKEGKNPLDIANHTEANSRIEEHLELMLVERGLPSRKTFLFSAPQVVRVIARLMGYSVPREQLRKSADYERTDTFVLERARWGLVSYALKRALDAALGLSADNPRDVRLRQACLVLRETNIKFHGFLRIIGNPLAAPSALAEARRMRQMLTVMSYEGDVVGGAVKYLDLWESAKEYPEASVIAARLYRQSLFGLLADKPWYLKPKIEDIKLYESESRQEALARQAAAAPSVGYTSDDLEIETLEIVKEKIQAAESRLATSGWRPDPGDWLERMQSERAHRGALIEVQEKLGPGADLNPVIATALAMDNPEVLKSADLSQTARAEQLMSEYPGMFDIYREAYRRELTRSVGLCPVDEEKAVLEVRQLQKIADVENKVRERFDLSPSYSVALDTGNAAFAAGLPPIEAQVLERVRNGLSSTPELLQIFDDSRANGIDIHKRLEDLKAQLSVVPNARQAADADLQENIRRNENWARYFEQLDEPNRLRFLAHQYADSFLAKYVELTVSNSSVVSLTSPSQPGIFQKLRQLALPSQDSFVGKSVRNVLRALESPMDNSAYRPGFGNWLRRNVPWYQDTKSAMQYSLRIMWMSLSVGYLTNYYLWQVKFSWPTALFFLGTGTIISIMHYWVDRLMINMGIRPMSDTWSKIRYSLIYTWLTYPSYIPFLFYYDNFERFWSQWITTPLQQVLDSTANICEDLLRTIF